MHKHKHKHKHNHKQHRRGGGRGLNLFSGLRSIGIGASLALLLYFGFWKEAGSLCVQSRVLYHFPATTTSWKPVLIPDVHVTYSPAFLRTSNALFQLRHREPNAAGSRQPNPKSKAKNTRLRVWGLGLRVRNNETVIKSCKGGRPQAFPKPACLVLVPGYVLSLLVLFEIGLFNYPTHVAVGGDVPPAQKNRV